MKQIKKTPPSILGITSGFALGTLLFGVGIFSASTDGNRWWILFCGCCSWSNLTFSLTDLRDRYRILNNEEETP